jgi:hypothetical protein
MPICIGCGNEFTAYRKNQKRCVGNCGKGRRGMRASEFIGVDGEGITFAGQHHYVLLSVGDQSLHREGSPLNWRTIFNFLYDQHIAHPRVTFVGFFLGYDFTQWLKTLPESRAAMLLSPAGIAARQRKESGGNPTPFPVYADEWEFDLLAGKRFKLRPRDVDKATWMTICDAGPFFQSSFIAAIDPKRWQTPVCSPEEYATILEGKINRSTAKFDPAMIHYNVTENLVLSRLMERLDQGFRHAGIKLKPNQWFGPGQAASEWLKLIGAPRSEDVADVTPKDAISAARASYYGGWFEIFYHGLIPGTTYGYDINSAYPYAISKLPCLLHGKWVHDEVEGADVAMVYARVSAPAGSDHLGAMMHRDVKGRILRPLTTVGWYHRRELDARRLSASDVEIFDAWSYVQTCDHKPFEPIVALYNERLQVGKNSPAGIALKLLYNSAYGKTAQSVGRPVFANPIYASLITATTRAMILDAVLTHPGGIRSLIMVATDGVYFRELHPNLPMSETQLGLWSDENKQDMSVFMPGVYWDEKTRKSLASGGTPVIRSRGISGQDLAARIGDIDQRWREFDGVSWPTLEIPVRFAMTTARQAIAQGAWERAGHVTSGVRTISSEPSNKRQPIAELHDGAWRTRPYDVAENGIISVPYAKPIGIDFEPVNLDGQGITDEIYDLLRTA